jgi:hypothetical protein
MSMQSYWSVEACGWVSSRGRDGALTTPWSGRELPGLLPPREPLDAAGVLRMRPAAAARADVPAPRDAEPAQQDALR